MKTIWSFSSFDLTHASSSLRLARIARVFLLIFLPLISNAQSSPQALGTPTDPRVENLIAFAKLYGYVRYFHPSDECSAVDWNRFVHHGVNEVLQIRDTMELLQKLRSLFLPLAPTMQLYRNELTPALVLQTKQRSDDVLVTWQHRGIEIDPKYLYRSVRLGRIDWDRPGGYGLVKALVQPDLGGKIFRLSAMIKGSADSEGVIDVSTFQGNKRQSTSAEIRGEWRNISITDTFPAGTTYALVSIKLKGEGRIHLSDLEIAMQDEAGHEVIFDAAKSWTLDRHMGSEPDFSGWNTYGKWNSYQIETLDSDTCLTISNKRGILPGSLFVQHASPDNHIVKKLGSGITCRFPVTLYLDKEPP